MPDFIPAYVRLHLRSIDDNDQLGAPQREPLQAFLTLEASAQVLGLLPRQAPEILLWGSSRRFAILSARPLEQGEVGLVVGRLNDVSPAASEYGLPKEKLAGFSMSTSFQASPKQAADIEKLAEFLERRGTTVSLAHRAMATPAN